ncbi:MAG: protein kinase [Armatimonadetes bacterium]|nr:protein kinase [Armatimonadota bacterium]
MQTEISSPETLGPYTLIREIGHGGMSVVHQAVDRRTGKTVALKVHAIPPSLAATERRSVLARFGREARAMARLSHPGIIAIHEVGEQDGMHFLAMEYLDGLPLSERLESGPLTASEAAPILSQVAEAIDAVHAAGVVHRDIKPSNVMLLPDGTAKLLDFGVARQSEDTTITATHSIVGSPTYMAPERVEGALGDPPSDIWALGVLLYEMLAGRPPFEGASIPSVLYQVTHATPAPIPHLSGPVQQVVRRALEKDLQRRYPTARALADALTAALQTSAGPAWAAPLRRWGPWAAMLAVIVGVGQGLVMRHRQTPPPERNTAAVQPLTSVPTASRPVVTSPSPPPHPARHSRGYRRSPAMSSAPTIPARLAPVRQTQRRRMTQRGYIPVAVRPPAPSPGKVVAPRHTLHQTAPAHPRNVRPIPPPRPVELDAQPTPRRHPVPWYLRREPPLPRPEAGPATQAQPPAMRPGQPREDKDSETRKLQDLEKFIWSEGR